MYWSADGSKTSLWGVVRSEVWLGIIGDQLGLPAVWLHSSSSPTLPCLKGRSQADRSLFMRSSLFIVIFCDGAGLRCLLGECVVFSPHSPLCLSFSPVAYLVIHRIQSRLHALNIKSEYPNLTGVQLCCWMHSLKGERSTREGNSL